MNRDASLWGAEAADEAAVRLGWTDLHETSRDLLPRLTGLQDDCRARGLSRVVLCGMGGSSLAPEVICRHHDEDLVVIDTSHPDMIRAALVDLESTVVVVSSKSGGTVETDSQMRVFWKAFEDAGLPAAAHFVFVTDPGSALAAHGEEHGVEVVLADPEVGGRYSALSAFGLVPTALAGVDVAALLDEAAAIAEELITDEPTNPGLILGALLGVGARSGVDVMMLHHHMLEGLGDWIEQLVAESTGKHGRGILPVTVTDGGTPPMPDAMTIDIGATQPRADAWSANITYPLGAQFLLWEFATAVAGHFIGINPFDQPDVETSKIAARELLTAPTAAIAPDFRDGTIDVHGSTADGLTAALTDLFDEVGAENYLGLQVYLDRSRHAGWERITEVLTSRLARPVTFGWGPRYLHSTGQYHKGGPATGVFLQVTATPEQDLAVPGTDFSFGELIASQAAGDARILRERGLPVLRLHLNDEDADLVRIESAVHD